MILIALKGAQNTYIYWFLSKQGECHVYYPGNSASDRQSWLSVDSITFIFYLFRFITNLYDFVVLLIFYNHIMRLHFFWDNLFLGNVRIELEQKGLENEYLQEEFRIANVACERSKLL